MRRADWTIEFMDGAVVAIVDADLGGMSVTNDAEAIVIAVDESVHLGTRRLIYRDSTGRWDELLHEAGRFAGFAHLGGETLTQALAKVAVTNRSRAA